MGKERWGGGKGSGAHFILGTDTDTRHAYTHSRKRTHTQTHREWTWRRTVPPFLWGRTKVWKCPPRWHFPIVVCPRYDGSNLNANLIVLLPNFKTLRFRQIDTGRRKKKKSVSSVGHRDYGSVKSRNTPRSHRLAASSFLLQSCQRDVWRAVRRLASDNFFFYATFFSESTRLGNFI